MAVRHLYVLRHGTAGPFGELIDTVWTVWPQAGEDRAVERWVTDMIGLPSVRGRGTRRT